jgi:hypothetical protein
MGFIIPCKWGIRGSPKIESCQKAFFYLALVEESKGPKAPKSGSLFCLGPILSGPNFTPKNYKEPMHTTRADFHLTSLEICALQQVSCSNTSFGWVFDWPSGISPYYTEYICIWPLGVVFFKTRPRLIIRTFINSNTWNHTQPKGKEMQRVSIKNLDSYPFNTLH